MHVNIARTASNDSLLIDRRFQRQRREVDDLVHELNDRGAYNGRYVGGLADEHPDRPRHDISEVRDVVTRRDTVDRRRHRRLGRLRRLQP